MAVPAESVAYEQVHETHAPDMLTATEAHLRPEERSQTFEDDPAKVSRQTATEMHMICCQQATQETASEGEKCIPGNGAVQLQRGHVLS